MFTWSLSMSGSTDTTADLSAFLSSSSCSPVSSACGKVILSFVLFVSSMMYLDDHIKYRRGLSDFQREFGGFRRVGWFGTVGRLDLSGQPRPAPTGAAEGRSSRYRRSYPQG